MIWRILGIQQTKDKKAITRAYREMLSSTNPEEKPEEFKQLRAAYEEALKLADQEELPLEEKSELDLWVEELADIYNNFQARMDVEAWRDLMSHEICQALDTRPQAEEALLVFLMDHYQMSQKVMCYLEEEFAFSERVDELLEHFPRDFVEYILIDLARYGEPLPLEMFEPGFDAAACDEYTMLYHQARRVSAEEAEGIFAKMLASPESHPHGQCMILKHAIGQGDFSVLPKLRALAEEWPEDQHMMVNLAHAYKLAGDWEQMIPLCEKILERDPESLPAKRYLAEADAAAGNYEIAIRKLNQLLRNSNLDTSEAYEINMLRSECDQAYAEQLKEDLSAAPDDHEKRYNLIWCYLENNNRPEANALVADLPEGQPDAFSYYNLKAVLAETDGQAEEALNYLEKLLEVIRNLQPDGTEKTDMRIGRLYETMGRIGGVLSSLNRYEEADQLINRILEENPDDLDQLLQLSQLAIGIRKYEKAIALADRYIRQAARNSFAYYLKASACFRMRNDGLAFQLVNTALELDGVDLQSYLLKLRILVRNRAFEAADELFAFLERNGIVDNPTVEFCRFQRYALDEDAEIPMMQEVPADGENPGQMQDASEDGENPGQMSDAVAESENPEQMTEEQKKLNRMQKILQMGAEIDRKLQSGESDMFYWTSEFYYLYAEMTLDYQRMVDTVVAEDVIAILDKGIAMDSYDTECLHFKGWILKRNNQFKEALEIYKKVEEDPNHGLAVERELAEIHYKALGTQAAEALHYYEILIENDPENTEYRFYAGMCCLRLNRLEEACQHFQKERELDPEDIDGYFRGAAALLKMNRLEEALELAIATVEMAKKRDEDDISRFYRPLIQIYRRMGQADEAIRVIGPGGASPILAPFQDDEAESMIFSILMQFGRYAEAEALARKAMNSTNREIRKEGYSQLVEVLMIQEKEQKLTAHLSYYKKDIDEYRNRRAEIFLAGLKDDYRTVVPLYEKLNKDLVDQGLENLSLQIGYIRTLWMSGAWDAAKEEALKVIEIADRRAQQTVPDRLLYQTKWAFLLALTGRIQEAREHLQALKREPLCENCVYCRCKDADVYLCEVELIAGEYEKAYEMAIEGLKCWPDEEDLLVVKYYAEHRMKTKKNE